MTKLGYQIPNFTYPDGDRESLFGTVVAQAQAADRSGFDTVLLMDHFYQLPMLGRPEDYMLECYTSLGALARETSNVRLGALVTGNTYRNPTLLAKIITTLDIVSGGRAQLGIGAGWFELEHDALGFEFKTFTDRFQKLEEALQIIIPMLKGERPTFHGKHYAVRDAINEPQPIGPIPVMIGGSGEKKTLRIVAQYADESNLTSPHDELEHKLEVLAGHCEKVGRDRSEITVSQHLNGCIAPTHDQAYDELKTFLAARGIDLESMDDNMKAFILGRLVWGDPDEVGEQLSNVLAKGADGITISLPGQAHEPERVELIGNVASKVVGTESAV
ncbi:MAG TPA: LLM class F420-dependent oxidoreductase [Actinomycetota bacterium]|jgi:F420-dependent oxidoreductase-like protein|nr:LLM class F420-dependent oxidoreductase [Actinomycetota bacterium]